MEYHKVPCTGGSVQTLAPCYSSCTSLTLVTSLLVTDYCRIFMPMTHSWCSVDVVNNSCFKASTNCVDKMDAWMASNRLKLNQYKTYGVHRQITDISIWFTNFSQFLLSTTLVSRWRVTCQCSPLTIISRSMLLSVSTYHKLPSFAVNRSRKDPGHSTGQ